MKGSSREPMGAKRRGTRGAGGQGLEVALIALSGLAACTFAGWLAEDEARQVLFLVE